MILTSSYKLIRSVFEPRSEMAISEQRDHPGYPSTYSFRIGNIGYQVEFFSFNKWGTYNVEFKIVSFIGTLKEKVAFLSKAYKRDIMEIVGTGLFAEAVDRLLDEFLRSHKVYDIVGAGRSITVLSHVIAAIDRFVEDKDPAALQFDASEPSRKSLYAKIAERYKKKGMVKGVNFEEGGHYDTFTIWLKGPA
jgi:hypothetical protein